MTAILTGLLLLTAASAAGFSDVGAGDWFAPYVEACAQEGLMEGTGDGRFGPEGGVTRAECWAVALRLAGRAVDPAPRTWGQMVLELEDGTQWPLDASLDWTTAAEETADFLSLDPLALPDGALERLPRVYGLPERGEQFPAVLSFPDSGGRFDGTLCAYELDAGFDGERVLRVAFTPQGGLAQMDNDLYAASQTPRPGTWYRDLAWTCCQAGWLRQVETGSLDGRASRGAMAHILYRAGPELTPANQVESVPDATGDSQLLELYRAGIFQGVDPYGTFQGASPITRAELAATAARMARPELRLRFTLEELPYRDYTLTPLLPGYTVEGEAMVTPGLMWLTRYSEDGKLVDSGVLRADGSFRVPDLDLTRCRWTMIPGCPLVGVEKEEAGAYVRGILDLDTGTMPVPLGPYELCQPTGDGQIVLCTGLGAPPQLLDGEGRLLAQLPANASPYDYSEGLSPDSDPDTRLFGYVDLTGAWALPPRWTWADAFYDGYAVVHSETGTGAIDKTGAEVLPCRYDRVTHLGGGLFCCVDQDGGVLLADGVSGTAAPNPYVWDGTVWSNGYLSSYDRILDRSGTPVTPAFDSSTSASVGPVDGDGSAFVIVDRRVYRLTFTEKP